MTGLARLWLLFADQQSLELLVVLLRDPPPIARNFEHTLGHKVAAHRLGGIREFDALPD